MRDYEQTIRELRDPQYVYHYSRDYIKNMMDDAADAIEELTRENKEISFRAAQLEAMNDALIGETGAADALMVVSQPRWMPLPEPPKEERSL